MPWRVRKQLMLILLGCAAIVLGLIVVARNFDSLDIELLAALGVLVGVAIIVTALPTNGS